MPLALPGLAAGSVFTFSLTLGDYIIPSVVGAPGYFIGMMVYQQQGTAGNIPLAAAFSVVPIVLIMIYLALAGGRERSMRSRPSAMRIEPSLGCALAAYAGLAFMHLPVLVIILYAFTTDGSHVRVSAAGLDAALVRAAFARSDIWAAMRLSLQVAAVATCSRSVLGTLDRARLARAHSAARKASPAARAADRAARHRHRHRAARGDQGARHRSRLLDDRRGPHDVLHRDRLQQRRRALAPPAAELVEASMDLGADGWQTFRYVVLPQIATALLAGGMLAFALSFDEIIVTLFTAGHERTLPIWFFNELFRPRERPITNVVAVIVIVVTLIPILLAYYLTSLPTSGTAGPMNTKLFINGKLVAGQGLEGRRARSRHRQGARAVAEARRNRSQARSKRRAKAFPRGRRPRRRIARRCC